MNRSAHYVGERTFVVEETASVPPGPGQVRIDVAYTGICGTAAVSAWRWSRRWRAGADVIGVSAGLEETGSEVAQRVAARGRPFVPYRADLSERAAVRALAEWLGQRERPIDILVNNAGTIRRAPAVEHTDEDWEPSDAAAYVHGAVIPADGGRLAR